MDLKLKNQIALVTAASRGLGFAAARALSAEGAHLMISSRTADIDTAAEKIRKETGNPVISFRADLTKGEEILALVDHTLEHYRRIDILVINAGGPIPGKFLDLPENEWEKSIQLTVMSAVRLCRAVIPVMVRQKSGSIVASQSISVKQPVNNLTLSNALRPAVVGLMKTLADELGPMGIRVNSIHPGWTRTSRVDQLLESRAVANGTTKAEEAALVTAAIPLGRMGDVDGYGRSVAFLASPAASFIHGHALMFDGGESRFPL